jgi:hypothetical protein
MIGWAEAADGSGDLVPCEDVGRYSTLEDAEEVAVHVLLCGNAVAIDLLNGDRKVKTLYPPGQRH